MKFSEQWHYAGLIATEVRFKGYLETNPANLARIKENPSRIARRIRSSGRINSFISVAMVLALAFLSLTVVISDTSGGNPEARLAVSFTLFLLFSYVILFFLNLTTTTGFFASRAMSLPSMLPFKQTDLEALAVLAFARVFIAPAILLLTVYPIAAFIFFGPLTAMVTLVGCAATVALSIGSLVGFSKWFYKKTHSTDTSRISTIIRLGATFGLVLGFLSIYMIGIILPEIVRIVLEFATSFGSIAFTFLSLVFPFSFGFVASLVTYGLVFTLDTIIVSLASTIFYCLIAVVAFRKAGSILRSVSIGGVTEGRIGLLREVRLDITTPLKAIVKKDLNLATKNVGSAFVFIIPLFLAFMMYPMIAFWGGGVRSMTVLTAAEYANIFGGISSVAILMFDTQGASTQEGLPQSTRLTLHAKTIIAFPLYVFSLLLLGIIVGLQPLFTPLLIVIIIAQIPAGYAISTLVGGIIYKIRGDGRAVAISFSTDSGIVFLAGVIGGLVGIIPLIGYGLTMILTGSHVLCLLVQVVVAVMIAIIANRGVSKLLKD